MGNKWKAHRDTKNKSQHANGILERLKTIHFVLSCLVAAPFGIYIGYLNLAPKVVVVVGERLETNNPLPMLLNVTNAGPLSVYSVKLTCEIDSIYNTSAFGMEGFSITDLPSQRKEIKPGGVATLHCPVNVGPDLAKAEFTARVSFRPAYWPFRTDTVERFSALIGQDGKVTWRTKDPIDHKDS